MIVDYAEDVKMANRILSGLTKFGTTGKLVLRKEEAYGKEEMERRRKAENGIGRLEE